MDMKEKLVELLENHCAVIGEDNCKASQSVKCTQRDCAICLASDLIANGVTVQEWISVKDRLPENEQNVLVSDDGFIAVWTFYGDYWEDSHGWWQEFDEVTYWMPLPQPPKGE